MQSKPLAQTRRDAKAFGKRWINQWRGSMECSLFWIEFLEDVHGVVNPRSKFEFNKQMKFRNPEREEKEPAIVSVYGNRFDLLVTQVPPSTVDLYKAFWRKASYYAIYLDLPRIPQHIIVSNYRTMYVYDTKKSLFKDVTVVQLDNLAEKIQEFDFIRKSTVAHVPWSLLHYQNE